MCDINHLALEERDKQAIGITIYQIIMQGESIFAVISED